MTAPQNPRVTQADRELAAQIMELQERQEIADMIRAGDRDSSNTVQTVARHREAAEGEAKAREAMLRDIANEAAFLIDRLRDLDWSQDYDDFANSYSGHVDPSESRLRGLIADYRALTKEPDA